MVITILSTGSRGDTQPYIALGIELKKAGHTVRLAAFENFKNFAESYGLEFFPIKGDISKVASSDFIADAQKADNPLKILLSFNKLKSLVYSLQKDFFSACTGADAVVYHPGAAIGYFAAQHLGIPAILATPFPMAPTAEFPALIFYNSFRAGKAYNLITHRIFEKIMWSATSSPVKQFLQNKFGRVPGGFGCPYPHQITRTAPTIMSCSQYVFPRPDDWPEYVHNTGYWFLEEEEGWEPSQELMNFLQNGAAPVYVGFGSVGDPKSAVQTTRLVMDSLKLSGQRGVLATGWSGMSNIENVPEDIFILESAPHSWLFPRMAAVVHHGGAGTTAAGLRAGVPVVIVPHSNDQFAWGRRVLELGVASKPIPRKQLTSEKLSEAIQFALTKPIKSAADELGRKIHGENGAAKAAEIILDSIAQYRLFHQGMDNPK